MALFPELHETFLQYSSFGNGLKLLQCLLDGWSEYTHGSIYQIITSNQHVPGKFIYCLSPQFIH